MTFLLNKSIARKSPQADPPAPEVLVTTVRPQDVPRVLERVATLDGFINANINAQVQGYIVSRDYQEGGVVKKGDLLFQIDSRPYEAALAQAKGTLAKDKANQVKADADEKRAMDLFNKKVISDQVSICPMTRHWQNGLRKLLWTPSSFRLARRWYSRSSCPKDT
jgi:membrane fusion protein (multidrug efflux system)